MDVWFSSRFSPLQENRCTSCIPPMLKNNPITLHECPLQKYFVFCIGTEKLLVESVVHRKIFSFDFKFQDIILDQICILFPVSFNLHLCINHQIQTVDCSPCILSHKDNYDSQNHLNSFVIMINRNFAVWLYAHKK